ncbi:porin [Hymenobacter defluvii]|uniref:Porin n=1 Tax=Hymenobacter defluvii TaxID=2054411 RepID=A0ABS3TCJ2_9BACT|nr:porin [Hymenobacter defluvii]MBO3270359.1 porin [Hymenobacter defluvii]
MKHCYVLLSILLLLSQLAAAQISLDTVARPSPITLYGYIDGYYGYDFPHPDNTSRPGFFYSHNRQNEFTVNQALIGLRYDDGNIRGALGLQAGTYPEANYAAEPTLLRSIYEAYAGFRPLKKTWLDIGVFGAHVGFESAISKDNWTVTHSLAAEGSPYYEAGARFTYKASDKLTLTALALNGWQNIRDNNRAKSVGTQVQWRPTEKLLFNYSTLFGNEQPQDSVRRFRYFHDFYVTYTATSRLQALLWFDIGKQEKRRPDTKDDTWHTTAAIVRYQLSPQWFVAARGEYYYARNGVVVRDLGPTPNEPDYFVRGGSLNFDYRPNKHVLARLEGKILNARNPIFANTDGAFRHTYGNLTSTIALSF